MIAEFDWGGFTALMLAVIGALTTALVTLIPIYFKAKKGQDVLSEAIEEAAANGGDVAEHIKKRTDTDPNLRKHLDGVRKAATRRLEKR